MFTLVLVQGFVLVLFSNIRAARSDCADFTRCANTMAMTSLAGYPFTNCNQGVKDGVENIKQCLVDIIDGNINIHGCLSPTEVDMFTYVSSMSDVIKRQIESLANVLCKGCPFFELSGKCSVNKIMKLMEDHSCNVTALSFEVGNTFLCMMKQFTKNDKCQPLMEDFLKLSGASVDSVPVVVRTFCNQPENGLAVRRSLESYREFLGLFK